MDTIQALSILSPEEKTETGLKLAYHRACKRHHPDKGGSLEIMKLVNAAYDFLKNCDTWWTGEQSRKAKRTTPLTETLQAMIDAIKNIPGFTIEIIGSWLWISGDTYNHKKILKSTGFKFSGNKKAWYYHEDAYQKRSKKSFSMDELRGLHGAEKIKTDKSKQIAA